MVREAHIRTFYRDPQAGVIGGVCAGIAESLDVDVLLVRVAAIVALIMTFGLVTALYLVLWTILPVKPDKGVFIEIEPSRVQSEHYEKVVNVRSDKAQPGKAEVKVIEERPRTYRSRRTARSLAAYRFSLLIFCISLVAITCIIALAISVSPGTTFLSFVPLYLISVGLFFMVMPSQSRPFSVRICMMVLCFEFCFVLLPFTLGLCTYEDLSFLQGPAFLLWISALILLFAAIIFENVSCYILAIFLILAAAVIGFHDLGLFDPALLASFEDLKEFIALGGQQSY